MKERKIARIIFFSFLALLSFSYIAFTAFSPLKMKILSGQRINIILLGVSEIDHTRMAEVIKLFSYEPETGFLDLLSIPRDTRVPVSSEVNWRGFQKLNEIYSRLENESKTVDEHMDKFGGVLNRILGEQISSDFYIIVDYNAFRDFVDAAGGVEIEVNSHKLYTDRAQDLHIDIAPGTHNMCGDTALKYVRYRDRVRGDMGRQVRQHRFLYSLLEQLKSFKVLPRIPSLAEAVFSNIRSNMNISDFIVIAEELRSFRPENFRVQQIPGEPGMRWGISYWDIDRRGLDDIVDVILNSKSINLPLPAADRRRKLARTVTAEVWNASGIPGIARDTTRYLRERNVDVVRYGNYGVIRRQTQIISRRGDRNAEQGVREVAAMLGCRNTRTDIDTSRMVDINVVIGKDFVPPWDEPDGFAGLSRP